MMNHRLSIVLLFSFAIRLLGAEPSAKPNIILIYSDDHGYADLGVQGSVTDIRTPNIDALARDGVRFNAAMSARRNVCRRARG